MNVFSTSFPNVHAILLGSIAFLFLNIRLDIYFGQFWYLRKYDDDLLIPLRFAPKGVIKEKIICKNISHILVSDMDNSVVHCKSQVY